jgi:hypothetical protein
LFSASRAGGTSLGAKLRESEMVKLCQDLVETAAGLEGGGRCAVSRFILQLCIMYLRL